MIASQTGLEQPPVGQLPVLVAPMWTRLEAFLSPEGLMHVEEQTTERPAK